MTTKVSLNEIRLRNELLPGDLGYVAYLHGILYAKERGYGFNFEGYVLDGLGEFAHQYDATKDRIWVCEHEGKIIGFLMAFGREDSIQLRYFIFLPEYRGIGLGKKLMEEFISFMKERGVTRAYLWTTNEQEEAIGLYLRYGFRLTEEKKSDAFDKKLVERRYDLKIV
ncbi:GNAT family N-acetyltransferase [Chitinophaga sp. S165]|uniref:GNAT family N-acetyltransferase n=1 Tax=Chitinophaga sp. S165 TaxID=2135462 RepID=UPI000D7120AF|nr:GNAT family N-acetyltransferase [Chitinophaga sp. S165]PWV49057.1 acetyltransferase (GNAT) family protein [Chitinophaga sp. S165]